MCGPSSPNRTNVPVDGWRDCALLLFLYNYGARVSEATGINGAIFSWCRRG